jgi:hypothetical protein
MTSADRNIIAGRFSITCNQRVLCAVGAKLPKFQAILLTILLLQKKHKIKEACMGKVYLHGFLCALCV